MLEEYKVDETPPLGALFKPPRDPEQKVYVVPLRTRWGQEYENESLKIEQRLAGGLIPNWFPDSDDQIGWAFDNYFHAYAYLLKRKAMKGK